MAGSGWSSPATGDDSCWTTARRGGASGQASLTDDEQMVAPRADAVHLKSNIQHRLRPAPPTSSSHPSRSHDPSSSPPSDQQIHLPTTMLQCALNHMAFSCLYKTIESTSKTHNRVGSFLPSQREGRGLRPWEREKLVGQVGLSWAKWASSQAGPVGLGESMGSSGLRSPVGPGKPVIKV
ncbi:hypothetical protein ACLOJK_040498 [Asimina triloba]